MTPHAPIDAAAAIPLSRPIVVDDVPEAGLDVEVTATSEECAAVAADIDVPGIASLSGRFHISRRTGGLVAVTGEVTAHVTQMCVVSLEPFDTDVTQEVDLIFAAPVTALASAEPGRRRETNRRRAPPAPRAAPVVIEPMDENAPDPIINGRIDLGGVTAEFLTLGLDLYPRKPGVAFEDLVDVSDSGRSAFAALERLKDQS